MRRADAGVQRNPDGSWTIADDHLERAARYENAALMHADGVSSRIGRDRAGSGIG